MAIQEGGWSTQHPGRSTPGKQAGSQCTEGRVWPIAGPDGQGEEEISCPACVRAAVRPAHSETLHGLRYSNSRQSFKLN
jgi:hypothetical protein